MITFIELIDKTKNSHKAKLPELSGQFDYQRFPLPLANSFQNISKAINAKDKSTTLTLFANDLSTTALQFLALLACCDYSQCQVRKSHEMYAAIENMFNRPGPGKWLGFLRTWVLFQQKHPKFKSSFPELSCFISGYELQKDGIRNICIENNYHKENTKEMGLLEFLVDFRNNMGHTKGYDENLVNLLFEPIIEISMLLAEELSFLYLYQLISENHKDKETAHITYKDLSRLGEAVPKQNMLIKTNMDIISVFPFFIAGETKNGDLTDVFMLEAIKGKKVLFSSHNMIVEKSSDADHEALYLMKILKDIYVEPEVLKESVVTWEQVKKRSNDFFNSLNLPKPSDKETLRSDFNPSAIWLNLGVPFLNSGKKVVFMAGKNSNENIEIGRFFHDKLTGNEFPNNIAMLIIPDAFNVSDTNKGTLPLDLFIKKQLGLQGDLKNILRRISLKHPQSQIIFIFNGLNSFSIKGKENHVILKFLMDFIYQYKTLENLRFFVTANTQFYSISFNKYMEVFLGKLEDISYIPENKIIITLNEEQRNKNIFNILTATLRKYF